ncbi:hypothetical protein [Tibeticola sediminis]|uniref:hypothetical protein n=1 Tax=Tibeticola sediminis TaxID=1917811 RepID=UPI000F53363A|nr:hypothetical protein [Tibeticola sediminis]
MPIISRLKRLLLVLLLLGGAAIVFAFAFFVAVVGSAIAFSGSTGTAHQSFLNSLAPFVGFAAGAIAFGGLVAILNAVLVPKGVWAKSIAASSVFGGLAAALNPAIAKALLSLFLPVLGFVGKAVLSK